MTSRLPDDRYAPVRPQSETTGAPDGEESVPLVGLKVENEEEELLGLETDEDK